MPLAVLPTEREKQISMKKPVREIVEQALLTRGGMAGALVNNNGDIIFLHGRSRLFLEPPPHEVETILLLKM